MDKAAYLAWKQRLNSGIIAGLDFTWNAEVNALIGDPKNSCRAPSWFVWK